MFVYECNCVSFSKNIENGFTQNIEVVSLKNSGSISQIESITTYYRYVSSFKSRLKVCLLFPRVRAECFHSIALLLHKQILYEHDKLVLKELLAF